MINKLCTGFAVAILAVAGSACATTDAVNVNANANANPTIASNTTHPASDNSEITINTDATGVKTETRVFHNNPRVSRVVVTTTADGKRTTTVYGPTGESKSLKDETVDVLAAAGNAIADAAGWTVDKTKNALNETGDKLEDAKDKSVSGAKEVGDKLEDVGDKTASGAKKVGRKTVQGAKKAGSAIKKAVTP